MYFLPSNKVIITSIATAFFLACAVKKDVAITSIPEDEDMIERVFDTIDVMPELDFKDTLPKKYNASATMAYDILHTSLDLRFDWSKQQVIGKANILVKPFFKPISEIKLDAVGFVINQVNVNGSLAKYDYNMQSLTIFLPKEAKRGEKIDLFIDYVAKPNENETSGSEAIKSDKGLFFIDPLEKDAEMPSQIWTQGETEHNSRWFPTFDKPNERFTQEIKLTVEDKYLTLSNGRKVSSTKNLDGTRTDIWRQDKPHAPYLAMIAVGEFHEEMDVWEGKPLHYVVEKGWAKYAKKIYNHTPEMLSFFSSKLGYPYPWDKYAQVAVREYVSGAMENTSAVIFGEFVQKTDREMIDNDNDQIVAHEMFHHWFGDLVTCEDWSNLTLNEGFANYAEYLWYEHKYGRERAEFHRLNELSGYLGQVSNGGAHALINYYYRSSEDMFDAHSYNKGGLVLHMLRNYVGDEAFFASLNKYLVDNEFTSVEVDELRMAFEDTTGEDMHWFFDQWFLGKGHPTVSTTFEYNASEKTLKVHTDQSETPSDFYQPFNLPLEVAIYYPDGTMEFRPIRITDMIQDFTFENVKTKPETYVLDGRGTTLMISKENKDLVEFKVQTMRSENLMDKIYGVTALANNPDGQALLGAKDMFNSMLSSSSHIIRIIALQFVSDEIMNEAGMTTRIEDVVLKDPHSDVRNMALQRLTQVSDYDPTNLCTLILESEQAYPVISTALSIVGGDEDKAKRYFERYKNDPSDALTGTLTSILVEENDDVLTFLESKAQRVATTHLVEFFTNLQQYVNGKSVKTIDRLSQTLIQIASLKGGNDYRKYMSFNTLLMMSNDLAARGGNDDGAQSLSKTLKTIIVTVIKNEDDKDLRERYEESMKKE